MPKGKDTSNGLREAIVAAWAGEGLRNNWQAIWSSCTWSSSPQHHNEKKTEQGWFSSKTWTWKHNWGSQNCICTNRTTSGDVELLALNAQRYFWQKPDSTSIETPHTHFGVWQWMGDDLRLFAATGHGHLAVINWTKYSFLIGRSDIQHRRSVQKISYKEQGKTESYFDYHSRYRCMFLEPSESLDLAS